MRVRTILPPDRPGLSSRCRHGSAEPTHFEPCWLEPAPAWAETPPAARIFPAILNLPAGWTVGDAAAVAVIDQSGPEDHRHGRIVVAPAGKDAAVLEFDAKLAREAAEGGAAAPGDLLLAGLFGALVALRRDAGAGLVAAVGYGPAGAAVLLAAGETEAARYLGPAGPRFTAAAALGPGRPAFAMGATPAAEERWAERAPLLCAALATAALSGPPEAVRQDCIAALAGSVAKPGAAVASRPGQMRR